MYSLKDRLIDWANQRGAWTHILAAVVIALIITAIILGVAMPSKGVVNDNKTDIGELKSTMVAVVDGLATKASQAELDSFAGNVTEALDDQEVDINGLEARANTADNRINEARGNITTMQGNITTMWNDIEAITCSPPEGYLTGTFGNYTLHAECNEAGTFTANVHLVYSAPLRIGNTTTHDEILSAFYSEIIWVETTPTYVAVVTFNGTAWGISEVWWSVGAFELAANTEKEIDISCAWLNSTWEPSFAYVEVYAINFGE